MRSAALSKRRGGRTTIGTTGLRQSPAIVAALPAAGQVHRNQDGHAGWTDGSGSAARGARSPLRWAAAGRSGPPCRPRRAPSPARAASRAIAGRARRASGPDVSLASVMRPPCCQVLPETCHETLGILAFLLPHDGQGLVQQAVAGGTGIPGHQPGLARTLIAACEVDTLPQRELDQPGAAERHVHLGAGRWPASSVVVRQLIITSQPQQDRRDHG